MHLRTPATVCCCVFLWTLMLWPLDCCMLPRMCSTLMHRLGEPRVSLTLPSLMLLPLQLFLFHWSVLTRVHSINSDELIDLIWWFTALLHQTLLWSWLLQLIFILFVLSMLTRMHSSPHNCFSLWVCWHECPALTQIWFVLFFFALLHSCVRLFCCHDYCS